MNDIKKHFLVSEDIVLGITGADIYAGDLNFVFGQAELNGNYALVSTARLRNTFYGAPEEDEKLFNKRISTEVVHELGHIFGLNHCLSTRCVMFFSNSILDTDRKGDEFCNLCKEKLLRRGLHL